MLTGIELFGNSELFEKFTETDDYDEVTDLFIKELDKRNVSKEDFMKLNKYFNYQKDFGPDGDDLTKNDPTNSMFGYYMFSFNQKKNNLSFINKDNLYNILDCCLFLCCNYCKRFAVMAFILATQWRILDKFKEVGAMYQMGITFVNYGIRHSQIVYNYSLCPNYVIDLEYVKSTFRLS